MPWPFQALVVTGIIAALIGLGRRLQPASPHWYLSPAVAFPLLFTLFYGFGSLNLPINQRDDINAASFFLRRVPPAVPWIALVGLGAYLLGSAMTWLLHDHGAQRRGPARPSVWAASRIEVVTLVALAGSILCVLLSFARSGVPLLARVVSVARVDFAAANGPVLLVYYTLAIVAAGFAVLGAFAPDEAGRLRRRLLLVVSLAVVAAGAVLLGGRGSLIEVMLFVVPLMALVRRKSPPWRHLAVAVCVLVVFFAAYGIYRDSQLLGGFRVYSGIYASVGFPASLTPLAPIYSYWRLPIVTMGRVVEVMPVPGYGGGRFLAAGLAGVLPGHNPGSDIMFKELVGLQFTGGAGLPASVLGVFYGDFGLYGVAGGMALMGAALTFCWERLRRSQSPGLMLAYAYLLKVALWSLFAGPLPYINTLVAGLALAVVAGAMPVYDRSHGHQRIAAWAATSALTMGLLVLLAAYKLLSTSSG